MNNKKWGICFLALTLALLIGAAFLTGVIDPFFHYHAPLDSLEYPINNQRYQNYGILEHFSYDAIITGSSMTENFKASECNELFGVNSVKTCLGGGTFKEVVRQLRHAIESNPDIHTIFYGLDAWLFFESKDAMRTDAEYPDYLYDDSLFNDTEYLLNKSILLQNTLEVLRYTQSGNLTTSFDEYSFWAQQAVFDTEYVKSNYVRQEKVSEVPAVGIYFKENAQETLEQNLLPLVAENPDIQFYFFFTPYSILQMDSQNQEMLLELQFEVLACVSQQLLSFDNVHLFSFFDDYETITDLDNYFDTLHYSDAINSLMLQRMSRGEYELTPENCTNYWDAVCAYYLAYDYDALFE